MVKTNNSKKVDHDPKLQKQGYRTLRIFLKWLLIPLILYGLIFFILQPHYFGNFSNGFYLDNGDGFQNVWNIWWVNQSLGEQAGNPYFTDMLHWPHGISLFPQTMNVINGIIAIPLMNIFGLSLVQATNFVVVFAFVFSGVTMFWFIQKLFSSYAVSLVAGGLYTFSSFHFAHAQGHLQLVTFQFIPLFLLTFWLLLEKMQYKYAVMAAGSLFLVLLSDYYYLFWCVLLGGMWLVWKAYKKEVSINKKTIKVMGLFAVISTVLVGPLVLALLRLNKRDPLLGSHDPSQFGLDPVSVVLPGGSWYWHTLTDWYTKHLEYFAESSVFFGFGIISVILYVFFKMFLSKTKHTAPSAITFWWIVLIVFGLLALGPHPSIYGKTLHTVPLPYAGLEKIFPTLEISGMPIRWVLISLIAAIVIVSYALSRLDLSQRRARGLLLIFIAVSFFDLWPRALPLTPTKQQPYVSFLHSLPDGAVIDNGALSGSEQLYNQTTHNKPIAFGYVTRVPKSVDEKDFHIFAALEEKRYDELCEKFRVRYVTLPVERPLRENTFPAVYNDGKTLIYDMKNSDNC